MDDLLEHLRGEIAMDGDEGTPAHRLDGFVHAYFNTQRANHSSSFSPSTITQQNLDSTFNEFVWRQLISLPEITVAYLRPATLTVQQQPSLAQEDQDISTAATPAPPGGDDQHATADTPEQSAPLAAPSSIASPAIDQSPAPDTDAMAVDVTFEDISVARVPKPRKGKGPSLKAKKAALKSTLTDLNKRQRDARIADQHVQTFEFVLIDPHEVHATPRYQLEETYGAQNLRIAANTEACYRAITGSHERHSRLTHLCYQILQAIARGRERGKTVIELGHEFSHDQKSLFHFVKNLVEMNLIVKFRVLDARAYTSRCIHRHYLETSEYWATQLVRDNDNDKSRKKGDADNADDEELDDDADTNTSAKPSLITVAHLHANEPLIRSRIISALKRGEHNMQPHANLIFECGFATRPPRLECRRFNRIINNLCDQGLVERVGITRDASRGTTSYVRLKEQQGAQNTEAQNDVIEQASMLNDSRVNVVLAIPVERQAIDFVAEAGAAGATIREVRAGVGDINHRIIETLLARFEKNPQPPHLSDYQLISVIETEGRQKRLRYFTLSGYRERCQQDGIQAPDSASSPYEDLAGGFSVNEATGYYDRPRAFARHVSTVNTTVGTANARKADGTRRPRLGKAAPRPKKTKAVIDKPEQGENGSDAQPPAKRQRKSRAKPAKKAEAAEAAASTEDVQGASQSADGPATSEPPVVAAAAAAASESDQSDLPPMRRRGRPPGSRKLLKIQAAIDEHIANGTAVPQELLDALERCKKVKYTCKAKQLSAAERVEMTGIADAFEEAQTFALNPVLATAPSKRKRKADASDTAATSETAQAPGAKRRPRPRKKVAAELVAILADEPAMTPPAPAMTHPVAAPSVRETFARIQELGKSKAQTKKQPWSAAAKEAAAAARQKTPTTGFSGASERSLLEAVNALASGRSAIGDDAVEATTATDVPMAEAAGSVNVVEHNIQQNAEMLLVSANADAVVDTNEAPAVDGDSAVKASANTFEAAPDLASGTATAPQPTEHASTVLLDLPRPRVTSMESNSAPKAPQLPIIRPKAATAGPVRRMLKIPQVPAGSRVNLSNLRHERDLEQLLISIGGIAEEIDMLKQLYEYKLAKVEPGQPAYRLDKRTERIVMTGLEERGVIKRSRMQLSLGHGKMVTRSVIYLTSVDIAGQAGQQFAQRLQQKTLEAAHTKSWLNDRPVLHQKGASKPVADKRQRLQRLVEADLVTEDPRQLFSADWRVAAQWYGWLPGAIARARLLFEFMHTHREALVDFSKASAAAKESKLVTIDSLVPMMPLSTFVKIIPCTSLSAGLDDFLGSHDATLATVESVSPELRHHLIPDVSPCYKRLRRLLDILTYLQLVLPNSHRSTDDVGSIGDAVLPDSAEVVRAWSLASSVPIHDFGSPDEHLPLLGEIEMLTEEDVAKYWTVTEALCKGEAVNPASLAPAANLYASPDRNSAHAQMLVQRKLWRCSPTMNKAQKTYVERYIKKLGRKAASLSNSESSMAQLATSICIADTTVVKSYVNRLRKKLPRRRKAATHTKNTTSIAVDPEIDVLRPPPMMQSEDSASEPEERPRRSQRQMVQPLLTPSDSLLYKEQIWQAYVREAQRLHGWFTFDQQHLQYLHNWFLSPDGLSVQALSEHLQTMIEDASMLKIAAGTWTKPNPPYGDFRTSDHYVGRNHWASTPLPPAPVLPHSANRQTPAPAVQAAQLAAVAEPSSVDAITPMEPVTIDEGIHKTVTAGWNAAEDDQLRDFYIILWAKVNTSPSSTELPKVDIGPVLQYYPRCDKRTVMDRLRRLCTHDSETPYIDALGAAWMELWMQHRGSALLPDPFPGDATKTDLLRCRALLCSKLNKQAIRFATMAPTSSNSTRAELPRSSFEVAESFAYRAKSGLSKVDEAGSWDFLWGLTTVAQRSIIYHSRAFVQETKKIDNLGGPLRAADRTAAVNTINRLQQRDTKDMRATAQAFSDRLQAEKTIEWPNIAEDGDMVAICEMFSRNTIDLKLDTSITLEGRPYGDYRTRRIDDSSFENLVTVNLRTES